MTQTAIILNYGKTPKRNKLVKLIKWADRKFEFNFPVSLFPAIVSRIAGTPARLDEIASTLTNEQLTQKKGDEWSVQEHIGHLVDLEELHHKRFEEYLNNAEELSPADMTNKKTYQANHNSEDIKNILRSFRSVRKDFVGELDVLDSETVSRTAMHPRLKQPMRLIDNIYFAAEHDDHHIAIIRSMIQNFELNK